MAAARRRGQDEEAGESLHAGDYSRDCPAAVAAVPWPLSYSRDISAGPARRLLARSRIDRFNNYRDKSHDTVDPNERCIKTLPVRYDS